MRIDVATMENLSHLEEMSKTMIKNLHIEIKKLNDQIYALQDRIRMLENPKKTEEKKDPLKKVMKDMEDWVGKI